MKKLIFILLMCFAVAFAAFAIDMSPHPGDPIETVFTVLDNVVMIQGEIVPAVNVLHFEQINYEVFITVGVSADIGLEMEIIVTPYNNLGFAQLTIIDESRGGYLHFASHYQQAVFYS